MCNILITTAIFSAWIFHSFWCWCVREDQRKRWKVGTVWLCTQVDDTSGGWILNRILCRSDQRVRPSEKVGIGNNFP